jgi:shikimate dehydrogenase
MNFGLIGKSVSHSFSKTYFQNKFLELNLKEYTYQNFDMLNLDNLKSIIIENNIDGLNVTKPFKENIILLLDEIDETAKIIGAVNCIKVIDKNDTKLLIGYNTDYYGFAQSIKPFLEPIHQKALILGTGGASKAIAYALKNIGVDYFFVTTGEKKTTNCFQYHELNTHVLNAFKLIVNCTPVGMYPNSDKCVSIPFEFLTSEHLLFDLIYNPEETLFLKKGKEKGAITINGLNMLKLQADKAWQIWNM